MSLEALFREGLVLMATVGGPTLGALLVVGLVIGVLQSATQIQEPSVGAFPRLTAFVLLIALTGPWLVTRLARFVASALEHLGDRVG